MREEVNVPSTPGNITQLLVALGDGKCEIIDQLLPLVYEELRVIAGRYMQNERRDHTLQTTEVVNEAYLKLVAQDELRFKNKSHFFAIAALAMRQFLVDYARRRKRAKRGGDLIKISLDNLIVITDEGINDIIAIDRALHKLAHVDERLTKVVELRYFAGRTIAEIAAMLGLSEVTIKRDWRAAKAWLRAEIKKQFAD